MRQDEFIRPWLTPFTMDIYFARRTILREVEKISKLFSGTVLDVGCGQMPYREIILSSARVERYIGLDLVNNDIYQNKPDLTWDGTTIPLAENAVDCVLTTEVFEHCPDPEATMKEIFRVLRPDGLLFFTVPFLWPLHDVPYDQYRYTPFSLKRHLANAGFHKIHMQSMGGWDESLAQMIGLYIRRKPMSVYTRIVLLVLAYPIVLLLSKMGKRESAKKSREEFGESSMITGLWGVAYKPDFQAQ